MDDAGTAQTRRRPDRKAGPWPIMAAFLAAASGAPAGAQAQVPAREPGPRSAAARMRADVPLPPPRPPEQGPPTPGHDGSGAVPRAVPPVMPPGPPVAPAGEKLACAKLLDSGKVVARAIAPVTGDGGCGIAAPVEVSAVTVAPGRRIGLPPVTVGCGMAAVFADWVIEDLVPLFDRAGLPLTGLTGTSGYSCRGRNRIVGAKLSQHGTGEAIDMSGFSTVNGGTVGVGDSRTTLLADIRRTACARFATVLGPGSDAFHGDHLHVDLAARHNGFKLCEWTLP